MKGSLVDWEGPGSNCYGPRKRAGGGGWDAHHSPQSSTHRLSWSCAETAAHEHMQGCLL